MLDVTKLGNSIEEIDFVILIVLILVEIVIDVFKGNRRSYRDSIANIAIAIVYVFTSTAAVYLIAFTGLTFFSQFSLMQITTNSWTLILAIAIADFLYYWEHRVEHRIRFFWAYHSVHHSSTDYNYTVSVQTILGRNLFFMDLLYSNGTARLRSDTNHRQLFKLVWHIKPGFTLKKLVGLGNVGKNI